MASINNHSLHGIHDASKKTTSVNVLIQNNAVLKDWVNALIEAAAEDFATAPYDSQIKTAVSVFEANKGAPCSREELLTLQNMVYNSHQSDINANMREFIQEHTASSTSVSKLIEQTLKKNSARIQKLRNPFDDVIQNKDGVRDQEVVLWEDKDHLVLLDTFAHNTFKTLVIPKRSVSVPTDLESSEVDRLETIASHVDQWIQQQFGDASSKVASPSWINPPQYLTVKQLHMHIQPGTGPVFPMPLRQLFQVDPQTATSFKNAVESASLALNTLIPTNP
jgi:diadenosine tetraphosphate (Ap4A) HIT family hydrolase